MHPVTLAATLDTLPPFDATALLLDLDGTLLDLAPRPDAVIVPPGLTDTLLTLRRRLDNAVAVITGRPVEFVDSVLGDAVYAVAGEHGGAVRQALGAPVERPPLPSPPAAWLAAAERLAAAQPGLLLEHKARGFAVHFRAAPEAGSAVHDALTALLAGQDAFELLAAHMLWEVRPRGTDKGKAVDVLMAALPFRGRRPLFIGDDVTDEDAIRTARAMGGAGFQVDAAFGSPAGVRRWLRESAEKGTWAELPAATNAGGCYTNRRKD
jgi:trehalose 6-phosphate phosphatase